ncbi:MAG TPA: hypothetical protein V6D47_16710 [Oscillatoriaceae cyanobacterium]
MRFLPAVLLLPCLLAACAHVPSAPLLPRVGAFAVRDGGDLYPLAKGEKWTYALDQKQDQNPVQHAEMTISIDSVSKQADGATLAVMNRKYGTFKPPATRVLHYPNRVVLSRLSDPIDGPSLTILHLPLVKGDSWPGRDFGGGNTETVTAKGAEPVQVPLGTYTAQRVDHSIRYSNGKTDTLSYWYAPGVGVVKMIENSTVFEGSRTVHLTATGSLKAYQAGG